MKIQYLMSSPDTIFNFYNIFVNAAEEIKLFLVAGVIQLLFLVESLLLPFEAIFNFATTTMTTKLHLVVVPHSHP